MRRPVLPLAGRCLLVAVLTVSFVGAGGEGGPARVEVLHLLAPGGARPREVWVYRPAGPDDPDRPVLYFLHGVPGHPGDVFAQGGLPAALAAYLRSGGRRSW